MNINPLRIVLVPLLALLATGCAPDSRSGGGGASAKPRMYIDVPNPKEAPPPPPRQNVPLDKQLAGAARQKVTDCLRATDPLLRTQALEALQNCSDALATQQIIDAMRDKERGVRFSAAMAAGTLRLKKAYPAVQRLANDQSPSVQVAARYALHKLGDHRRSNDLGEFATHENPFVRRNVALVLGLLGEKSAISSILRPMKLDHDPVVRQYVYDALWRLGDEDAVKQLVALTVSKYADDKVIGLLALAAPKRQTVRQHVRGLLAGDDVQVEVSLVAARAMGMLGSDEGYAIAQSSAKSQDPQQRFLAALAFGAIGRSDAQESLRKLLADPDKNVQLAAASAILQLNAKT